MRAACTWPGLYPLLLAASEPALGPAAREFESPLHAVLVAGYSIILCAGISLSSLHHCQLLFRRPIGNDMVFNCAPRPRASNVYPDTRVLE